jgi:hypothetical protein
MGDARKAALVVALVAALIVSAAACTQGVATEVRDAGAIAEVTTAPAVDATSPPISLVHTMPPAPVAVASTRPPVTTIAPMTNTATMTTAATTTARPTIADEFASALAPVDVDVLGTQVSVPARDSVARLWLLVGRPPTADELRTAVPAVVRDGVPLDALATLLLHSPDGAVAAPDAPADEFVSALFEGVLGREGSPGEVAVWVRGLGRGMSPGHVAVVLAESPEAARRTGTLAHEPLPAVAVDGVPRAVSDSVLRLYLGLLVRLPNVVELERDVDRYAAGEPLAAIADDLLRSREYRTRRPNGDPASVLAGLFEDVLGSHPSPAVIAGWAGQLVETASSGSVAVAFTESAIAVMRTGTTAPVAPDVGVDLPARVAIMPGTDVLAVGDSIMLGAAPALDRYFPGIAIDAEVGRQFSEGVSIVRALAERDAIPGTVIVHLGTNGSVTAGACDDLLNLLAGRRVVLVNLHVPRPWEAPNNEVLAACAARHAATIVDWHTEAVGLAPDGYHLGGSGTEAFAALVASAF